MSSFLCFVAASTVTKLYLKGNRKACVSLIPCQVDSSSSVVKMRKNDTFAFIFNVLF